MTTPLASTTLTTATTAPRSSAIEPFPDCELLPTMYEIVEVRLDGPPVEIFDLATLARVETFRVRSGSKVVRLIGEYQDGFLHYMISGGQGESEEWLIGPGLDIRTLTPDGWQPLENDLTFTPWFFADPSIVYRQSMAALEHMEHVAWEDIASREAGLFVGGPAAVAAYFAADETPESTAKVKIWMSPDCYPLRVQLEFEDGLPFDWELYDLGAAVSLDIPEDMQN